MDSGGIVDSNNDAREAYGRVLANFVGMDDETWEASAFSSAEITVTTN